MKLAIPPSGHSLGAGLRELLDAGGSVCRIELAPQSPFAGDPEFRSSSLAAWTIANSGKANVLDANTTVPDHLAIHQAAGQSSVWFGSGRDGPYVYQDLSGDFDLYMACKAGPAGFGTFNNAGFMVQSTLNDGDWFEVSFETRGGGCHRVVSTDNDSSTEYIAYLGNLDNQAGWMGELGWLRVNRTGSVFTAYGWNHYTNAWQSLKAITRGDFSSDARVGFVMYSNEFTGKFFATCDFIRTWPPYLTSEPVSTVVIDSGSAGTTWDMSTFNALVNPYAEYNPQVRIGFGSLSYQFGVGNSNPPALNGSDLTEAQLQAQPDQVGRYFKLQVKYSSLTGQEQAAFLGATIDATVSSGADYPGESDVRAGVPYAAGDGDLTGTLAVPAPGNVRLGIQYGAAGTEFTGTLFVPGSGSATTIVELADAVAATITSLVQGAGGEVTRQYVPRLKLEQMGDDLFVTVVPAAIQNSKRQDRGSYTREPAIDIAVQKRVASSEEADELVELVDQVGHLLWQVPSMAGATLLDVQVTPVFAPEHLDEKGVFTSVVRVTYRQGRSVA